MGAEQIAFGIAQMKQYQLVTGGDAKTGGIGIITEPRLKKNTGHAGEKQTDRRQQGAV